MMNDLIKDAISNFDRAQAAKENGDDEKAISLYSDAMKLFQEGVEYETEKSEKKKINGALKTLKQLLDLLHKEKAKKQKMKRLQQQTGGLSKPNKSAFKNSISTVIDSLNNVMDPDERQRSQDLNDAIVRESPNVKWDDVVGLEEAKKVLKDAAIYPFSQPQVYKDREPCTGILLFGPNGTGKTYLAKALATEAKCTFFSASPADLVTKWQGDSEGRVKALFKKARKSPGSRAIIFIDEIDCLFGNRSESKSSERRIIDQFFTEMRGLGPKQHSGHVLVIGATNYPEKLDPAFHSRFQDQVYIPLPNLKARIKMLKLHIGDEHKLTDNEFMRLGEKLNGASGSDIKAYVDKVLREPMNEAQDARQFIPDGDFMMPCEDYPNCSSCTPKLSNDPKDTNYDCDSCGAKRMTMEEVGCGKLKLRDVRIDDFEKVLMQEPIATVPASELERYEEWRARVQKGNNK